MVMLLAFMLIAACCFMLIKYEPGPRLHMRDNVMMIQAVMHGYDFSPDLAGYERLNMSNCKYLMNDLSGSSGLLAANLPVRQLCTLLSAYAYPFKSAVLRFPALLHCLMYLTRLTF